jgi:hypothetical protein
MRYSHSWRNQRKLPRLDEEYASTTRGSTGFGYDPEDMRQLDLLIAAKCKTPRLL